MSKNVAVFVDVANIFYAAKAAGVDIDYVTLLKAASAGRDLVRAYAYTGLDPDNENQRNFHDFLRRSNYKVVSKDIRKYGDGKVKANLDIELVVDMMKTARNLDIAIVVSGDGDFAPAIRAVQEQGVRVEVISFRGNTSSDLIEVADQFTDIVQLARVEKGTRSGRRVADDDADLSMTEVPDKQTEGTGAGRGRGRGRGRGPVAEPVAAASRGRSRTRPGTPEVPAAARAEGAGVVALPGERLARAGAPLSEADLAQAEVFTLDDLDDAATDAAAAAASGGDEPAEEGGETRRRRRRGGRGRGRGRGRGDEAGAEDATDVPAAASASAPVASRNGGPARPVQLDETDEDLEDQEVDIAPPPRGPRTTPFGSVWDSQLGTPTGPSAASRAPLVDEEDFEEPEIPEYLIAERRGSGSGRGGQGGNRGGGARGGRAAYQSAMERERYGGRGGSGGVGGGGGGINRYPDVSGRTRSNLPPREERREDREVRRGGDRPAPAAPRSSNEPWSDVPPELEALLRAQVAQKPSPGRTPGGRAPVASTPAGVEQTPFDQERPVAETGTQAEAVETEAETVETEAAPQTEAAAPAATAAGKPRAARKTAATATGGKSAVKPAAKPRASRKASPEIAAAATDEPAPAATLEAAGEPAASETSEAPASKAAAKPRAARKPATSRTATAKSAKAAEAADTAEAPDTAAAGESAATTAEPEATPAAAPKRRSPRKTASTEPA